MMALVSGGRSTLNPNAPLFIPAAMRQVKDFSPQWWDLVTTSASYRDYWLSQHPGEDIFRMVDDGYDGNNVVGLLPDSIDLDVDEDILNMEAQFEEFLQSSDAEYGIKAGRVGGNGFHKNSDALVQIVNSNLIREPMLKYWEMPAEHVGSNYCVPFRRAAPLKF